MKISMPIKSSEFERVKSHRKKRALSLKKKASRRVLCSKKKLDASISALYKKKSGQTSFLLSVLKTLFFGSMDSGDRNVKFPARWRTSWCAVAERDFVIALKHFNWGRFQFFNCCEREFKNTASCYWHRSVRLKKRKGFLSCFFVVFFYFRFSIACQTRKCRCCRWFFCAPVPGALFTAAWNHDGTQHNVCRSS